MQPAVENTLTVTTNLMTNTYGTPRVYLETTSPAGYQECGDVIVGRNESGYMTITCKVTPTQAATGVTLHIVPKGSSDDRFCTDGTYTPDTSNCEAGNWKWGSLVIEVGDIAEPLTPMQDMTPELCASWDEGYTTRMVDARDGKAYWVAKLADGRCWMTQNLALDLDGRTLTPSDSDLDSSWTFNGNWYTSAQDGSRNITAIQGWNLGEYVWKNPDNMGYCGGSGVHDLSHPNCQPYWQSTTGMTAMTESRTDGVTIEGETYDAHYLAGNYYSFRAAIADTTTSDSGDASGSICPAGWHLPEYRGSNGYEYENLTNAYGISDNAAGAATIISSPLYFVRSGNVNPGNYLNSAGEDSIYWSADARNSDYTLSMSVESSRVPRIAATRWIGNMVRCVADLE